MELSTIMEQRIGNKPRKNILQALKENDHSKDPYVLKKQKDAIDFLQKHPLPALISKKH